LAPNRIANRIRPEPVPTDRHRLGSTVLPPGGYAKYVGLLFVWKSEFMASFPDRIETYLYKYFYL
jgi:hypothetical protein